MGGADELGDLRAEVVVDVDRVESDAAPGFVRAAGGDELFALRGGEEADRAVDGDRGLVVEVRDDRHGEIREREHRAAHDRAIGVQMIRRDGHFADRVVRTRFDDRTLCLRGILVLRKVFANFFKAVGLVYHERLLFVRSVFIYLYYNVKPSK